MYIISHTILPLPIDIEYRYRKSHLILTNSLDFSSFLHCSCYVRPEFNMEESQDMPVIGRAIEYRPIHEISLVFGTVPATLDQFQTEFNMEEYGFKICLWGFKRFILYALFYLPVVTYLYIYKKACHL